MKHFDELANEWDKPEKVEMFNQIINSAMSEINLTDVNSVLDFGCGTGLLGLGLLATCPQQDFDLLGIDTSEGMLAAMAKKEVSNVNITTKLLNLETDALADKFDLIVTSMAFHHLDDPEKVLLKLSHNLNPNGKILIIDLAKEDGSFHPDNVAMGVKHFGFSEEDLNLWSVEANFKYFDYKTVYTIEKNDRGYPIFMAYFHQS